MKNILSFIITIIFCSTAFAQLAPKKDFTEKLALRDQKKADALKKGTLTYNGNNYDLKYHRLCWSVDPNILYISGEVTSYFKTTQASVSQISFDMSSELVVDSVIYHSTDVSYTLTSSNALNISLPAALPLNQLDSVSVFYHGVPSGTGFGSFIKETHNSIPIVWTLSEPFGARDWWPCKNDLSDKIDSIDVYVTAPSQYLASSNGVKISETIQGADKITHWKHRYPIAAYLIAIAITNYQTLSVYAHFGTDSLEVLNHVYPENYSNALSNALNVVPSLELYDSLFIPYPYSNERYGQTQFNWGGGMEHQTNTFLCDFGHELMAHELAHQWVGDMITCGNWHEIWLNEGFATYWTGLTYNFLFNGVYWKQWKQIQIDDIVSQPDGSVYCTDTTSVNRIFDGRLSYKKGGMLLHMLRWVIGDSAFFAGMKNYLTDADLAYNYACSDDFITHMETAGDTDLTEFFNDWLYGEGYPTYAINCYVSSSGNDMTIVINQSQSHSSVSYFEMPVPLEFKNATHDTIVVFNNSFSGQQYALNLGFRPDSVKFDPELWIVSANNIANVSTPEIDYVESINIFPNPAEDILNIDYKGMNIESIEIYDVKGSLIKSIITEGMNGYLDIDISSFAEGIYSVKIKSADKIFYRKISKIP
ncbi:MAG TPA: M1 family aminopeptidase [Bacteroidales bacterium]|nr:M1 family aminopeptidase [Bacteroidales bacterium]HPS16592.1 M1 family aminopeptidase [Bacteroidales bacterium]